IHIHSRVTAGFRATATLALRSPPLDLDEPSSADKKGFDRMAVEIFDADFLVRSTLHDACNAHDVVTVTLVDLQPQSPFRMPGIDTDDGQPQLIQPGP